MEIIAEAMVGVRHLSIGVSSLLKQYVHQLVEPKVAGELEGTGPPHLKHSAFTSLAFGFNSFFDVYLSQKVKKRSYHYKITNVDC